MTNFSLINLKNYPIFFGWNLTVNSKIFEVCQLSSFPERERLHYFFLFFFFKYALGVFIYIPLLRNCYILMKFGIWNKKNLFIYWKRLLSEKFWQNMKSKLTRPRTPIKIFWSVPFFRKATSCLLWNGTIRFGNKKFSFM